METNHSTPHVAILGLGNTLLADDGVGARVARLLATGPPLPAGVRAVEVGTAALGALDLLEEADVVLLIDAAQAGQPPGTIFRFEAEEAETARPASLHRLSVLEALRFLPESARPSRVTVLGIEPEKIDYGLELSPTVEAALPRAARAALEFAAEAQEMKTINATV